MAVGDPHHLLIGREAELSELNRSLARAAEGTATLISGVPGVGKTTLLEAALAGLDGLPDGPVVVRARANPADRELAYVSLVDALCSVLDRIDAQTRDQVLEGLDSLGPLLEGYGLAASPGGGDSGGGGALERTRRLTGLRRLLARIGRTRGALLVLDDAHWADAATLEAIAHLSRELQDAGFSLCLLYRDDEVGPQLRRVIAQLRRVRGGVEVRLDALDLEETRRLAEQLLTAPVTDPLAELLHQRSAGIPLFTVALAELLARRDLLVREGGRLVPAAGAADVVPDEAHDLLMTRLADLSDSARTVLDTVAVAGGPVLRRRVLGVTGMAPDALDEAIRTLQRVALVRVDSEEADSVEIAHPLLAEAVDHRVASRSRALIHRRFADELEADPTADVGRLARHVQEAGGEIDPERALPILFTAGERALTRMAGVEAVSHFQAAFELCERAAPERRADALLGLGRGWSFAREFGRAADELGAATEAYRQLGRRVDAAVASATRGTMAHYGDDPQTARAAFATALGLMETAALPGDGSTTPEQATAQRLVHLSHAHFAYAQEQVDLVGQSALELQRLVDTDPSPAGTTAALLARTWQAHLSADFERARGLAQRLVEPGTTSADVQVAGPMPGLNGVWRGRSVLAQMAGQLGDEEQLDDHWRVLAELGERYSHPVLEWRAMLGGICQRLWKGQVDGAEDLLARAPSTVSAASDDLRRTHPALYGWCRWSAEDLDGLQELLAELDANVGGGGGDRTERGHPGLPALAGQQADLQLAVAELQGFPLDGDWVRALDRHPASPAVSPLLNRYVRGIALTAAGRAAEAEAAAEELRAMGATWVPGALADLVAAATTLAPDPEASLRSAHLARDAADRHGWALVRFRATMAMAHAAQRADLQQVGTDAARDSLDWAERHRLERSAARARRLLRGFGVQVASTGSEAHGGLTGRQWEVAGLVAAGLSNAEVADRLFISVRTVTTHLDHIFTRLDLTSRTALGAWYRDHQGDT